LSKVKSIIPFLSFEPVNQQIREASLVAFEQFFDDSWYILGQRLKSFETAYAHFNQVSYCIGTSNGLDSLILALKALGIKKGDEVLVPSNTFIASVLAITHCEATPIFIEPNPKTYNIDVLKIETAITSSTKAIVPVHLYGQACNMDSLIQIAKRHNLFVIEDNAQAQGATWDGQKTGSFGEINATSFYPGKNLGALGDAGAITTNNQKYADIIQSLRNYGSSKKYYNEQLGFNKRMDECQAVFLAVKLKYLQQWNAERQQIAKWYKDYLINIPEIILPQIAQKATSVYHLYVIRTKQRDELKNFLHKNGIETLIHYPVPPHLQECYQYLGYKMGDFPIAEELANTCLSLPIWPGLDEEKIKTITMLIKQFYE